MKTKSFLIGILTIFTFISCESDESDNENPNIDGELSRWTIKEYNQSNELFSSSELLIVDNKISKLISYGNNGDFDEVLFENDFIYLNNKLDKIITQSFSNNNTNEEHFIYNSNDELIEYRRLYNSNIVARWTFENNDDYILSTHFTSNDNGQTYELYNFGAYIKFRFDNNSNLLSSTEPTNDLIDGIEPELLYEYVYDNNNLLSVSEDPSTELNFTYTNNLNPIGQIYINTYGKKTFGLTRPRGNLMFWNNLSSNVLNTLSGQEISTYNINNTFNSGILTKMVIESDSFNNGTIDNTTVNEFIYE